MRWGASALARREGPTLEGRGAVFGTGLGREPLLTPRTASVIAMPQAAWRVIVPAKKQTPPKKTKGREERTAYYYFRREPRKVSDQRAGLIALGRTGKAISVRGKAISVGRRVTSLVMETHGRDTGGHVQTVLPLNR